jgi:ABC-type branched-subunit amino acid transport system substrate-binding protein
MFRMLRKHPRVSKQRTALVLALLLVSLVGCGTTVPLSQQSASALSGGDGLGGVTPTQGSSTGTGGTGGTALGGTTGSGLPTVGPSTTGPTGGAILGTGGTTGVASGLKDNSPVKVAVFHINGGNAVLSAAFPGSSVSFGDGKREATAIITEINAHGGAGGHKLIPTFIPVDATGGDDAGLQKACQGAVQDVHPMAIFAMFNLADGLATCARKAGVLLVDVALGAGDDHIYNNARDIAFSPSQMTRNAEQTLIIGLARAAGKLPAAKPVGILSESDFPMYGRVVKSTIEPLLTKLGVPFITQSLSNGADTGGMNAAVLKFLTSGVDTVLFSLGSGGIPEVLFMNAAEQQKFRPEYLMGDSTDTSFVGGTSPAAQIKRIWGAGTYPLANVRTDQYPSSPGEKKCLATLDKAIGGYNNRSSSLTGTLYCEMIESFAFVAGKVTGKLTPASWAAAYHLIGRAYRPVTTFSTNFLPGRMDGASGYRVLGFSTSCNCVTYLSPIRAVPAL